jgi:ankyrin repeat protein
MYDIGGGPTAKSLAQAAPPRRLTAVQRTAWHQIQEKGYPMPSTDFMVSAAGDGQLELVKLFVAAGFPVDSHDQSETALAAAARGGQEAVALYLIGAGADVNAKGGNGMTPLLSAADKCGMTEVLRALLVKRARLNVLTAGGASALNLARSAGCDANVALLSKD